MNIFQNISFTYFIAPFLVKESATLHLSTTAFKNNNIHLSVHISKIKTNNNQSAIIMDESNIPIDIHLKKLLDWLISRR